MPYVLKDLVVDRVDLVDEGANSAAFIELFKRKEISEVMSLEEILSKLKPEHAEVIKQAIDANESELAKARGDLEAANGALEEANSKLEEANATIETLKAKKCPECGEVLDEDGKCPNGCTTAKSASFDEAETLKSMPENVREVFLKMRAQKEAAEELVRKNAEEKAEAEAIAKAASLKAIPVEQERLVGIIKSASQDVVDLLTSINAAIEATVLEEVGKNAGNGAAKEVSTSDQAWEALEKKACEIAKRDNVTKEKAMSTALSENPDLYREYLKGGTN